MTTLMEYVDRIGEWTHLPRGVVLVMLGIFLAMVVGTIARLTHLHKLPQDTGRSLLRRLRTWWIISIIIAIVIILGHPAIVALMCVISILGVREYMALVPERTRYGGIVWSVYIATVLQYVWIFFDLFALCIIFIPVLMFLLLTLCIVLTRQPQGFVHMVGTLQWGMMMLVYCLSHAALLLTLDAQPNAAGGAIGWFLYLLILTEFNDIAQALFGRPLGKHKIIPQISPGKSWEGLIGAAACTTVLAVLLAPLLTSLDDTPARFADSFVDVPFYLSPWSIIAGVCISLAGFFGDITISAVKRDANVKDSGTFLPGQGGVLDRIDSLTFTAPLFFYYVYFLYYS